MNELLLEQMIKEKYVSVQKHPTEDLYIYNYTNKCQFEQMWNPVTVNCRGLIRNGNKEIVARPFEKFFNYEELDTTAPFFKQEFDVFDKLDGSLGITYFVKNRPYIATRGSFTSEQAIFATGLLYQKYIDEILFFDPKYTYLFEIIYPENRIVVDYHGMRDIVLIAMIETKSGKEVSYETMSMLATNSGFKVVERFNNLSQLNKLKAIKKENSEGFVVRFNGGARIKIKFEEYVRLHRLITGVNTRRVWELLSNGVGIDELVEKVPDEFYAWVKSTANDLQKKFESTRLGVNITFNLLFDPKETKKDFALKVLALPDAKRFSGLLFAMYDKKPIEERIWKLLKPEFALPFKIEI